MDKQRSKLVQNVRDISTYTLRQSRHVDFPVRNNLRDTFKFLPWRIDQSATVEKLNNHQQTWVLPVIV